MKVSFEVPGPPTPKGRPRFWNGHAVTPRGTRAYEALVRMAGGMAVRAVAGGTVPSGPVRVEVTAYHAIAASWPMAKKAVAAECGAWGRYRGGWILPRTDIDNVAKAVLDGLNGVAYIDDRQVVALTALKAWAERPRVEVVVEWMDGEDSEWAAKTCR